MGEPAYNLQDDDKSAITPDIPGLRALEGGGEGDGVPRGDLSSVKNGESEPGLFNAKGEKNNPKSSEELAKAESIAGAVGGIAAGISAGKVLTKFRAMSRKKKAGVAGGGISVIIGFVVFGAIIGSGPLAFLHFAQLLASGYSRKDDESDIRLANSVRFLYHVKNKQVYNSRLSVMGNKWGDRIEAKLNSSGLKSNYSANFGASFNGFQIDKSAPQHKNKSPAELRSMYADKYGVTLIDGPTKGSLIIPVDTNSKIFTVKGYYSQKSLIRQMLVDTGLSKKMARIESRVIAKRAGLSLSPLKRLDARITANADARYSEWQERRAAQIQNRAPAISVRAADDPNSTPEEKAARAADANQRAGAAGEVIETAKQPEGATKLSDTLNSKSVRTGIGLAAIVGTACIAKHIDEQYSTVRHEQNELPLMRTYARVASIAGQAIYGASNTDLLEQMGYEYQNFHNPGVGPNANSSFMSSQAMKTVAGDEDPEKGVAPDKVVTSLTGESPFAAFNSKDVNVILGPACSTGGTIVLGAVSFLGGPVSASAGLALSVLFLDDIIDYLVGHLKGEVVDLDNPRKWGADYGTYAAAGAMLTSQQEGVIAGATMLEQNEVEVMDRLAFEQKEAEFANSSLAHKLFNLEDNRSVAAGIIDNTNPSITSNTQQLATMLVNAGPLLSKTASQITSFRAKAEAPTSPMRFNLKAFGFSEGELDNPNVANPFQNGDDVTAILNDPEDGPKIQERVRKCMNIDLAKVVYDGAEVWDVNVGENTLQLNSKEYKEIYDSEDCGSNDTTWLKIRMFIKDTQNVKALSCYVGDDQSCTDLDFGGAQAQTSTPTQPGAGGTQTAGEFGGHSDNIGCPPGTKELGNTESRYTGAQKTVSGALRIKLCQLSSIGGFGNGPTGSMVSGGAVVNSAVAGAWQALGEKAKKDGVNLSANSSFRLRDSCGGGGDGTLCARPGTSMHQLGIAIDFAGPTIKDTRAKTCATRVRQPSNAVWTWLNNNAKAFGFGQYSVETWHWDALEGRCGGDGS